MSGWNDLVTGGLIGALIFAAFFGWAFASTLGCSMMNIRRYLATRKGRRHIDTDSGLFEEIANADISQPPQTEHRWIGWLMLLPCAINLLQGQLPQTILLASLSSGFLLPLKKTVRSWNARLQGVLGAAIVVATLIGHFSCLNRAMSNNDLRASMQSWDNAINTVVSVPYSVMSGILLGRVDAFSAYYDAGDRVFTPFTLWPNANCRSR